MSTKTKLSAIAVAVTTIITAVFIVSCSPKAVAPKPNDEPGLRKNKQNMMNRMDTTKTRR